MPPRLYPGPDTGFDYVPVMHRGGELSLNPRQQVALAKKLGIGHETSTGSTGAATHVTVEQHFHFHGYVVDDPVSLDRAGRALLPAIQKAAQSTFNRNI